MPGPILDSATRLTAGSQRGPVRRGSTARLSLTGYFLRASRHTPGGGHTQRVPPGDPRQGCAHQVTIRRAPRLPPHGFCWPWSITLRVSCVARIIPHPTIPLSLARLHVDTCSRQQSRTASGTCPLLQSPHAARQILRCTRNQRSTAQHPSHTTHAVILPGVTPHAADHGQALEMHQPCVEPRPTLARALHSPESWFPGRCSDLRLTSCPMHDGILPANVGSHTRRTTSAGRPTPQSRIMLQPQQSAMSALRAP